MSDQQKDFRPPWEITRTMFLSEEEIEPPSWRTCGGLRSGRENAPWHWRGGDRLIIESLLWSGVRNSELCRLRIDDTVVGCGESAYLVRGTPRQDRTVFVPQALSILVQALRARSPRRPRRLAIVRRIRQAAVARQRPRPAV